MILSPILIIFVLLFSFYITLRAYKRHSIKFKQNDENYLFLHNTWKLTVCSNIGTTFTLSLYLGGGIIAGYVYGKQLIIPLTISVLVSGFLFFIISVKRPNFLTSPNDRVISNYVGTLLNKNSQLVLVIIIVSICFGLISTELFFIREYLREVIFLNVEESLLYTLCIIIICYSYVRIAGFAGVIRTDVFQLFFIIGVAILLLLFSQSHDTARVVERLFKPNVTREVIFVTGLNKVLTYIGIILYFIFFLFSTQDFWTKIFGTLPGNFQRNSSELYVGKSKRLAVIFTFPILLVFLI